MVFIFGAGGKSVNAGQLYLPFWCSSCDEVSTFAITENYKYAHVYGIRLAKHSSKYFLVCHTCDRVIVIPSRDQFLAAQEIGRSTQSWGLDENTLIPLMAQTARRVLGLFEYATQLESPNYSNELELESAWVDDSPLELSGSAQNADLGEGESANPKNAPKFCSECGHSLGANELRFCTECGTKVSNE